MAGYLEILVRMKPPKISKTPASLIPQNWGRSNFPYIRLPPGNGLRQSQALPHNQNRPIGKVAWSVPRFVPVTNASIKSCWPLRASCRKESPANRSAFMVLYAKPSKTNQGQTMNDGLIRFSVCCSGFGRNESHQAHGLHQESEWKGKVTQNH